MTSCSTYVPVTRNDIPIRLPSICTRARECVPIQSSARENGAPPFRDSSSGVRANHHQTDPTTYFFSYLSLKPI